MWDNLHGINQGMSWAESAGRGRAEIFENVMDRAGPGRAAKNENVIGRAGPGREF